MLQLHYIETFDFYGKNKSNLEKIYDINFMKFVIIGKNRRVYNTKG